ncbi:hypothetical protein, partial [Lactiplantibacillus garii]|uniref:hypothetical protein n=1 Tax=Lactiplantibacillus garii TaxID=2306423 RepID=UPI001CDB65D4
HSIDEVASYREQNFNLKRNTAWVYISATYTKYIHHNQIDMDAKLPTASSFYEKAKTLFDEPLYPYEQVVAMIQAIDPKVQLSPVLIDKLGYVERSGLVMSKTCDSLDDASKKLWLMDDYVLVDKIKTYPNRWFTFKLYHHELAHNLIAMDETRYLTSTGLEKLGISKVDIENFL